MIDRETPRLIYLIYLKVEPSATQVMADIIVPCLVLPSLESRYDQGGQHQEDLQLACPEIKVCPC